MRHEVDDARHGPALSASGAVRPRSLRRGDRAGLRDQPRAPARARALRDPRRVRDRADRLPAVARALDAQRADRGRRGDHPAPVRVLRARGARGAARDDRARAARAQSGPRARGRAADDGRRAQQPVAPGRGRGAQPFRRAGVHDGDPAQRAALRGAEPRQADPALRRALEGRDRLSRARRGAAAPTSPAATAGDAAVAGVPRARQRARSGPGVIRRQENRNEHSPQRARPRHRCADPGCAPGIPGAPRSTRRARIASAPREIAVADIDPNPDQPRRVFEPAALERSPNRSACTACSSRSSCGARAIATSSSSASGAGARRSRRGLRQFRRSCSRSTRAIGSRWRWSRTSSGATSIRSSSRSRSARSRTRARRRRRSASAWAWTALRSRTTCGCSSSRARSRPTSRRAASRSVTPRRCSR